MCACVVVLFLMARALTAALRCGHISFIHLEESRHVFVCFYFVFIDAHAGERDVVMYICQIENIFECESSCFLNMPSA